MVRHIILRHAVIVRRRYTWWRWEGVPFGATAANEDPDGDGERVRFNLRFPGQYYDAETGLHYNYFRYYDPSTGRYITSDPIGLNGGLNTYLYANVNQLRYTDPNGLCPMCLVIPGVCAGGGCEALGLAIGAWWAAQNSSNDDNVIPGPWPDNTSPDDASDNPEQCPNYDQKKKEKNCLALYNTTLQSCASIKNR